MEQNMEIRSVNFEIRNMGEGESRTIEGYASVFTEEFQQLTNYWGEPFFERVAKGAFLKTLNDSHDIFMLVNHDWNKVVGRTGSNLELREDENGLWFQVDIPNTTDGNDLLENVRLGLIKGCSFGFNVLRQTTKWNDGSFYRTIDEVELFEVTATPIPAYEGTELTARSKINIAELRDKEFGSTSPKVETEKLDKRAALFLFDALTKLKEN